MKKSLREKHEARKNFTFATAKAFSNVEHNKVWFKFPNGNSVSTIWSTGSYSDNHDYMMEKYKKDPTHKPTLDEILSQFTTFFTSENCEVLVDCSKKLLKELNELFGSGRDSENSVIGYLSILQWLQVMNMVAHEKRRKKSKSK